MKKTIQNLGKGLFLALLLVAQVTIAQQNWKTVGNPDTGQDGILGGGLLGSTQNTDVHFITNSTIHGTFDGAGANLGFFGLNTFGVTNAPFARYHQNLGDLLVMGLTTQPGTATVPLAAGTLGDRLMWIESRGAFRAGGVNNAAPNAWDAINIGSNSVALGLNCIASGNNSMSFGGGCNASGLNSIAIGNGNAALANTDIAIGSGSTASGGNSVAIGNASTATATGSYAIGWSVNVSGFQSYGIGQANTVTNAWSGANGYNISLSGIGSYGLGCFLSGTASNTVTIGNGIGLANPLINNASNTMMVGFNSDYPTLFVSGGNGTVGTFGNVGIGLNASSAALTPSERLDVNGNGRFRNIPIVPANCLLLGQNVAGGGGAMDNSLTRLDFNGNTGTYFSGNGTWQNIPPQLCDWNMVTNGTSNDLVMGYAGACNTGRVGIGLSAPASKFHIAFTQNNA